ncbi:Wzz/FepE/Etk N-terminal domain-containing protein [Lichenihabitans sp. Uapishka_5]|uniref:tyrosine-protein kinase domain-containing protein n=1 Tax=Lichenihabitans sp. Uapishka_5 TaxID=3037302 RepID=UPI0029E7DB38|nr:Wzz/FepE/Etk N-terminal domain-containing protein [Lichenihabitans sp. Uapishka_5]MDX7950402.1 Wzz/FepE/Etk N-terminal domain-containing protein [Lichenihabitans sp. Uapishka_5]
MHHPRAAMAPDALTTEAIFGSGPRRPTFDADVALGQASELMDVLRRGRWIVAGCVCVSLALAIAYLVRTPPQYTAFAQVILEPRRLTPQEAATGSAAGLDSAQAESQMQVVRSERILSTVFETLDLASSPDFAASATPGLRQRVLAVVTTALPRLAPMLVTPGQARPDAARLQAFESFVDRVSVRRVGQSYVLEISCQAGSATEAARLTNAVTAAYVHSQIERKLAAARRGAEFLENRVASLEAEEAVAAAAIREGVIPSAPLPDSESRVISAARAPLGKSAPRTMLVLVFALAVGLLLGGGILAVRHSLDRRIRGASQIWRHFGLPCLAVLPAARRRGQRRLPFDLVISDAKGPFAQALRTAYTSIVTGSPRDGRFRSLGVASWRSGEGKSTLAGNLAHFIAAAGEPVRLVDADLQDPALSQELAPQAQGGLCEALAEHVETDRVPAQHLRRNLHFIPARNRYEPYRPNLFLGAPAMGQFLSRLRQHGDVVVDLPAMERSPHAQAVAGFLDGVILVAESGRTTFDELAMAIRVLDSAQATILGIVLNKGTSRLG